MSGAIAVIVVAAELDRIIVARARARGEGVQLINVAKNDAIERCVRLLSLLLPVRRYSCHYRPPSKTVAPVGDERQQEGR